MNKKTDLIERKEAYAGHYVDNKDLLKCASGGAASAIAEGFIKNGGVVISAGYSKDYKSALFYMIDDVNDINIIRDSKYFVTEKKVVVNENILSIYEFIAKLLVNKKSVLAIGLGCDIAAIYTYCKNHEIDTNQLYTIDLICHGPTFKEVHIGYIELLEKKYNSKIVNFSVKYKKKGWYPSYIYAQFENGKCFNEIWTDSIYKYAFDEFAREPCVDCKFKNENHRADLTVGDYWGIDKNKKVYNSAGVSAIIKNSEKGKELLENVDAMKFYLEPAELSHIVNGNPMYEKSRIRKRDSKLFLKNIKKYGLKKAVQKDMGQIRWIQFNLKKLVKRIIRRY